MSLGKWSKVEQAVNGSSFTFYFTDGQKCWNGPARSMTVTARCGVENEVGGQSERAALTGGWGVMRVKARTLSGEWLVWCAVGRPGLVGG